MSTEAEILEREISKKLATAERSLEDMVTKEEAMRNKKASLKKDIKDLKQRLKEISYLNIAIDVGEVYCLDMRKTINDNWGMSDILNIYKVLGVKKEQNSILVLKLTGRGNTEECTFSAKVAEMKLSKFSEIIKLLDYKKISEKKYCEYLSEASEAFLERNNKVINYNDPGDSYETYEED